MGWTVSPSSCVPRNQNSLELAAKHGCKTVAYPAISTGVYRYPKEDAAAIAVDTVVEWISEQSLPETVTFVLFSAADLSIYEGIVAQRSS
jgi:O-acetyl-ADP-ribose deacetylase (regulator of RNase III)